MLVAERYYSSKRGARFFEWAYDREKRTQHFGGKCVSGFGNDLIGNISAHGQRTASRRGQHRASPRLGRSKAPPRQYVCRPATKSEAWSYFVLQHV